MVNLVNLVGFIRDSVGGQLFVVIGLGVGREQALRSSGMGYQYVFPCRNCAPLVPAYESAVVSSFRFARLFRFAWFAGGL